MPSQKPILNIEQIRKDFPILQRKVHNKPLVYFDNAATSQKPNRVIEAMDYYYKNYNANIHRSIHQLGKKQLKNLRKRIKVAQFINANSYQNIVFTKGQQNH